MSIAHYHNFDTWDKEQIALKALQKRISKHLGKQTKWLERLTRQTPEDELMSDPESALCKLEILKFIAKLKGDAV